MGDSERPFLDISGEAPSEPELWEPISISGERIREEAERLASGPRPDDGFRESLIVHPAATAPGRGLAPGIEVRLSVLRPGESTAARRHNATEVNFCIAGSGETRVGDRRIEFGQYDVWNHPSWCPYRHRNDGDELQIRLCYSNAALLEQLRIHRWDEASPEPGTLEHEEPTDSAAVEQDESSHNPFGSFPLDENGAWLMPYETLISPPAVHSPTLHWPWQRVRAELDKLSALGRSYQGRRLYLLYNPMTARTNGTTPSFFATMTVRPPGIVDRPHRHVSAAINYYFSGSGYSRVEGKRYEWRAGDLMLSAPGWAVHNHASNPDEAVYELTIQDQPLNLAMESLLWQEEMSRPARLLGAQAGFETNRTLARS
jgi:gentisate 1,2-dioxygenase